LVRRSIRFSHRREELGDGVEEYLVENQKRAFFNIGAGDRLLQVFKERRGLLIRFDSKMFPLTNENVGKIVNEANRAKKMGDSYLPVSLVPSFPKTHWMDLPGGYNE
jgi:hypothetical protein